MSDRPVRHSRPRFCAKRKQVAVSSSSSSSSESTQRSLSESFVLSGDESETETDSSSAAISSSCSDQTASLTTSTSSIDSATAWDPRPKRRTTKAIVLRSSSADSESVDPTDKATLPPPREATPPPPPREATLPPRHTVGAVVRYAGSLRFEVNLVHDESTEESGSCSDATSSTGKDDVECSAQKELPCTAVGRRVLVNNLIGAAERAGDPALLFQDCVRNVETPLCSKYFKNREAVAMYWAQNVAYCDEVVVLEPAGGVSASCSLCGTRGVCVLKITVRRAPEGFVDEKCRATFDALVRAHKLKTLVTRYLTLRTFGAGGLAADNGASFAACRARAATEMDLLYRDANQLI